MYAVVYLEGHVPPPPPHTVKHGISNLYIFLKSTVYIQILSFCLDNTISITHLSSHDHV